MGRRAIESVGILIGATASCYLALLLSRFVWYAPQLTLAAFTDAEVWQVSISGLLPRMFLLPPTEGPTFIFGLYAAGSFLVAAVVFTAAWPALGRVAGWGRLVLIFGMFWTSLVVAESVVSWIRRGRGSFAGAISVLGLDGFMTPALPHVVGVMTGLLLLASLAHAVRYLDGEPGRPLGWRVARYFVWFALPLALLTLTPIGVVNSWWLRRSGIPHAPLLFACLIVLSALLLPERKGLSFRPRPRGGVLMALMAAMALSATLAYPSLRNQWGVPEFQNLTTRHWRLSFEQGALTPEQQQRWGERTDKRIEAIAARLGIEPAAEPLRAFVHNSAESKRAVIGGRWSDEPFSLEDDGSAIHILLQPDGEPADPRGEALLLARSAWGEAGFPALAEGVARYGTGDFHQHDLPSYARRIACEERPYSLQEVLGLQGEYLSPLVRDAMAGAWVQSLVSRNGDDIIKTLYRTAQDPGSMAAALEVSWPQIEQRWSIFLASSGDCPPVTADREERPFESAQQQGVSFSHEYGAAWGYGSSVSEKQLEKIHDLGANAVAVVPYAFTRAPESTEIRFRTDETDARVIRTIQRAKQLGLRTMLKPHLWTGRFTGDITFARRADFERWFAQYRQWLLHFARLAELYQVELLAMGNELGGLTPHEHAWRSLIRDIRRIYSGPLTYAANWGEEFETVAFWDELDYLGVNFYYPIAAHGETPEAQSAQVQAISDHIASVARRFHKPVLFTEVGFPSVRSAAAEPWRETSAGIDLDLQRDCYETVFEAFWGKPWLAGMYWWKWPTHGRGGPYDASYTPTGKPALQVLERWYQSKGRVLSNSRANRESP